MPDPMPDHTATLAPRSDAPRCEASTPQDGLPPPDDYLAAEHATDDQERYEAEKEHARGGLGRVVRAFDRRLRRTVAVKELLRHDPANEARFLREAMITARLEHPGIVPVHEAGRWPNGDPYYVMKLVEGRTLKELIAERHALRERLGLLPHVIAVADAVGYAHSQQVIHRDLKPSNVIVGWYGETIVVDWGLACDRKHGVPDAADELLLVASGSGVTTVSGKVVGTPAYMSPEQARGEVVDERGDVYALGAVLYEMLAGTPPHADTTPQAVLDRVIAGPPRPLAMVAAGVPGELATIVHKAMARDPDARYPNAIALAEDLRRFTTGQLVSAHSYSTWALVRKRLARHRGVVAVVAASAIALAFVGVVSFRRVVAEKDIAQAQRTVAEDALSSAEKRKRELVLLQAQTALVKDPTAALAWLKTSELGPTDRGTVVDVVDEALALGVARHVFWPGDWVFDARFTPDGKTVIAAVRDGILRSYDLASGFETDLGQAPSPPAMLVLSSDGQLAVTGGALGEVIVWPLHGGAPRVLAESGGRSISDLQISSDNRRLLIERESSAPQVLALDGKSADLLGPASGLKYAVAADDWSRVVMVSAPNEVAVASHGGGSHVIARADRAIARLAISPRGDTVVIHDGQVIWSLPFTGGPLRELAPYADEISNIVWSPDGKTIAIGGGRPEILLVDTATTAVRELRGHTDAIYLLAFNRDGTRLLSASDDATARVWQLSTRTAVVLRGHEDDVFRARFSADEHSVVTSSLDGSVRVWQLDAPGATAAVTTYDEGATINAFQFDGDRVLVRTPSEIARWDLVSGRREPLFSWAHESHNLGYGQASADGEHVVVPHADGSMELRSRTGASITLHGHRGLVTHVAFSRDGKTLFSSSSDGTLRRWDVATGAGSKVIEGGTPIRSFAVARDGRVAAFAVDLVYLVDADGTVTQLGKGNAWCLSMAEFEPVRDRLVLHRCDTSLAIFDDHKLTELATGGYSAGRVAVSGDGRRIASGLGDRTVRIWDAATGQVIDILRGHSDLVYDVAFSPDGSELASGSYDKTLRIWDLASKRHRVLRGHTGPVSRVAWRNASQLVTGSADGTIRLWQKPSLETPSSAEIEDRLNAATSARIDKDRPASGPRSARGT
ncbi:MAG TPA: protein kinase [Kofleriaceae bacterium]|nr:protein kinase [Kofleriaceae bacterium]